MFVSLMLQQTNACAAGLLVNVVAESCTISKVYSNSSKEDDSLFIKLFCVDVITLSSFSEA